MLDVVQMATEKLAGRVEEYSIPTGEVRKVSAALFNQIKQPSIDHVLQLSEELLKERKWALGVIAYDWAFRMRKQYNAVTFPVFERWLKEYVTDWKDCDDFCTHALGELLRQQAHLFPAVLEWTKHPDFWVRRGAAVTLIYSIRKNQYNGLNPYLISDALMEDPHYLVLKGYGWMLKVLSQQEPEQVAAYLVKNQPRMPRLAFRYALEKLPAEKKQWLLSLANEGAVR